MVTAYFTYTGKPSGFTETIEGTVVLKDNGATSVNLFNGNEFTITAQYAAKKLAGDIVAANFKHPAITRVESDAVNGEIVVALLQHTAELKTVWIEAVKEHCTDMWEKFQERSTWTDDQWRKEYNVPAILPNNKYAVGGQVQKLIADYSSKEYNQMRKAKDSLRKTLAGGKEKYFNKRIKTAQEHYRACVDKLAYRLQQKGLKSVEGLSVKSGWVDVNLEMIFEFDGKTVFARTIVAKGPIQCRHYRYIIT